MGNLFIDFYIQLGDEMAMNAVCVTRQQACSA
jgi:hypothetical protein